MKNPGPIHYYALQALAIRDSKTYVYGIPTLPTPKNGSISISRVIPTGDLRTYWGPLLSHRRMTSSILFGRIPRDQGHAFERFLTS